MQDRRLVTLDDLVRRHVANHAAPYWGWLRHVVTLATGSLTALVALQGHYVPRHPSWPALLALSWASMALAIGLGLFALREEYRGQMRAAAALQRERRELGDAAAAARVQARLGRAAPWHHLWAVRLTTTFFALGLGAICAFAIANLPWRG